MCGIVGIISKSPQGFFGKDTTVFDQLLYAGQLRGSHGTGIFFNNKKGKVSVVKAPEQASSFINSEKYINGFNLAGKEGTFLIGHNRFATKGAHNWANTHPFHEGDITLIHNGTLPVHKNLADVVVDSHAICHSINTIGTEQTIEKINGAFALVWYDKRNNSLNIIRNEDRPLFLVETKDLYVIVSEIRMAQWILARNGYYIFEEKDIKLLKPGLLVSFDTKTMEKTEKELPLRKIYTFNDDIYDVNWKKYTPPEKQKSSLLLDVKEQLPPVLSQAKIISIGGKAVGDMIPFTPLGIKTNGAAMYLEGLFESTFFKRPLEVKVRFYSSNKDLLERMEKSLDLVARVAAIVVETNSGRYFSVTTPFVGIETKNGVIIPEISYDTLPKTCSCCEGLFSHSPTQLMESTLERTSVDQSGWLAYCPECTDFMEDPVGNKKVLN